MSFWEFLVSMPSTDILSAADFFEMFAFFSISEIDSHNNVLSFTNSKDA